MQNLKMKQPKVFMRIELAQIFTQIVSFLIMYWVLKRFAWGPLLKIMRERKERIQTDFDTIDKKNEESQKILNEYKEKLKNAEGESKAITDAAEKKAHLIYKEAEEEARVKAKSIIKQAQDGLQMEVYKAKLQLKDELVQMAMSSAKKVIESKRNEKLAIDDLFKQVEAVEK